MVMAESQTGPYVFVASVLSRKDLPKGLKKQTKLSSIKPYRSFQSFLQFYLGLCKSSTTLLVPRLPQLYNL